MIRQTYKVVGVGQERDREEGSGCDKAPDREKGRAGKKLKERN